MVAVPERVAGEPGTVRVTVVSDGLMATPSPGTGGLQSVVYDLCCGLADSGVDVTLIAAQGSRCPRAKVVETVMPNLGNLVGSEAANAEAALNTNYDVLLDISHTHKAAYVDITKSVIFHQDVGPIAPHPRVYCISFSQGQRTCQWKDTPYKVVVIHNRVYNPPSVPEVERRDVALFMGNIVRHKGAHIAIEVAERAGYPLWIAGVPHEPVYAEVVLNECLKGRATYIGALKGMEKWRVLARVRMVICCANRGYTGYNETAQLVAMEAALMGTPVLGSMNGGLHEYVAEATGHCGKNIAEMVAAAPAVWGMDHDAVRAYALQNFTLESVMPRWVALLEGVAGESGASPDAI